MSIQLALLKSGEEVIADIKEIRQEETDELVSYLFKKPYCVKIKTSQVLVRTSKLDQNMNLHITNGCHYQKMMI